MMRSLNLPFAGDYDAMSFVTLCRREQPLRDAGRVKREADEAKRAALSPVCELRVRSLQRGISGANPMSTIANNLDHLSERELQVFERIAIGKPPARIAADLDLSVKTVSTYRARILEKLGIGSNAEIATLSIQIKTQPAIDAAADHALIAAALVAGIARWEPFSETNDGSGEVAVDGLRHATRLDTHGVPALTPMLRAKLTTALRPQVE